MNYKLNFLSCQPFCCCSYNAVAIAEILFHILPHQLPNRRQTAAKLVKREQMISVYKIKK